MKAKDMVIVVLVAVVLFFTFVDPMNNRAIITDKQDEISELFETEQVRVQKFTAEVTRLETELNVLTNLENISDADSQRLEALPAEIRRTKGLVLQVRILLGNYRYAYQVLQEMR